MPRYIPLPVSLVVLYFVTGTACSQTVSAPLPSPSGKPQNNVPTPQATPAFTLPPSTTPVFPHTFSYTLPRDAKTSAGVFDKDGHLVRELWRLRPETAGQHTEQWDGLDQLGQGAPAGSYIYKVVWSAGEYRNVGYIGNTMDSPGTAGHTPSSMIAVAVDGQGGIYTANGWDEAGADFKKWDRAGKSVYDAKYQIRNGTPNGMAYSLTTDDTYLYCGTRGWARAPFDEKQQVRRFRLSDGKNVPFTGAAVDKGHVTFMDWPSKKVPPEITGQEKSMRTLPIQALAVSGNILFVADAFHDQIVKLNKETGDTIGTIPCRLPRTLAIDTSGTLWVGHDRTKLSRITAASGESPVLTTVRSDFGEIESIAVAPNGQLYIADSVADQVKIFSADGKQLVHTFGQKAKPGDYAPDHFYRLRSVAVDRDGSFVTVQTEPTVGAHLARWTPEGKLIWERFGGEFVSVGNYSREHPDTFYTFALHRYQLKDRDKGEWEYRGNLLSSAIDFNKSPHGTPRILSLHGKEFAFFAAGDGMRVYRVDENELHLVALIGSKDPGPDGSPLPRTALGQWTWHDISGRGTPEASEIQWFRPQEKANYSCYGMDVDSKGNIWFANRPREAVWEIPLQGWDDRGNPIYDWSTAHEVVRRDTSPLKAQVIRALCGENGLLYVLAKTKYFGPYKSALWMGGNILICMDQQGNRRWVLHLPEVSVGFDFIPGGGFMLGGGSKGTIYHYTDDGLLVATMKPGPASGGVTTLLDTYACLAVNRNPADNLLDVFVEDDYVGRILWYRVDDHHMGEVSGTIP